MEEIENTLVEISDYLVRGGKILRTYDFILPKFHLILPKFYFSPTWRLFVFHVAIGDFLGRDPNPRKCRSAWSGCVAPVRAIIMRQPCLAAP